jgi:hypothetical protein
VPQRCVPMNYQLMRRTLAITVSSPVNRTFYTLRINRATRTISNTRGPFEKSTFTFAATPWLIPNLRFQDTAANVHDNGCRDTPRHAEIDFTPTTVFLCIIYIADHEFTMGQWRRSSMARAYIHLFGLYGHASRSRVSHDLRKFYTS